MSNYLTPSRNRLKMTSFTTMMKSIALAVLLVATVQSAPNSTKSFFPSSSASIAIVDISKSNTDPYVAEGSEFFPSSSSSNSGLKFPGGSSSKSNNNDYDNAKNSQSTQQEQEAQQQLDIVSANLPMEMSGSDEAAANEAIDHILRSARSGKSMDLGRDGEELVKVASDPVIREQLAAGNEVEARGYIRDKLCGLGLVPVSFFRISLISLV